MDGLKEKNLAIFKEMAKAYDEQERKVVLSVMPTEELLDCLKDRFNEMSLVIKQIEAITKKE